MHCHFEGRFPMVVWLYLSSSNVPVSSIPFMFRHVKCHYQQLWMLHALKQAHRITSPSNLLSLPSITEIDIMHVYPSYCSLCPSRHQVSSKSLWQAAWNSQLRATLHANASGTRVRVVTDLAVSLVDSEFNMQFLCCCNCMQAYYWMFNVGVSVAQIRVLSSVPNFNSKLIGWIGVQRV